MRMALELTKTGGQLGRNPLTIVLTYTGPSLQVLAAQQAVAARGEAESAATALAVAQARREYESKLAAALRSMQDSHAERCDLLEQHWQQASQVRQNGHPGADSFVSDTLSACTFCELRDNASFFPIWGPQRRLRRSRTTTCFPFRRGPRWTGPIKSQRMHGVVLKVKVTVSQLLDLCSFECVT